MQLKLPEQLNVGFKGLRGLGYLQDAYALRPDKLLVAFVQGKEAVELKPGEETEILVSVPLSKLPINANVIATKATLKVYESQVESSTRAEQATVGIKKGNQAEKTYELRVETPKRPRNVELKLDRGEVFWTHAGILSEASYELPNFVEQLNAYLDKVEPEGDQILLRFLVKSDTPGKVELQIDENDIEYSLLQTQTWKNPLDDTIRIDRNLDLEFGTIARIPLDPISNQSNQKFSLDKIGMDLGGDLSQERLLGSIDEHDGKEFAMLGNDYSLAQSFELDIPIRVAGVTVYFRASSQAELYIEIQHDLNGFPSAETPLTQSHLSIAPVENNGDKHWTSASFETSVDLETQNKRWTFASFETPVDLEAKKLYWVVIKGIRGQAQVGLQDQKGGYVPQVLINRGGQLWKSLSRRPNLAIAALLRLIYLPDIDNQTAAIEIGIEETQQFQKLDPGPEAKTISLDVNKQGNSKTTIAIKSHVRGSLSIANVIQEYKSV